MRRRLYVMYPVALIVLVWAEFGIVRAGLPAHVNTPPAPKNEPVTVATASERVSTNVIAEAHSNPNP